MTALMVMGMESERWNTLLAVSSGHTAMQPVYTRHLGKGQVTERRKPIKYKTTGARCDA